MNCEAEGRRIKEILRANLLEKWDGKECIVEMKTANATHWRQMEWIGWYFQWKAFDLLSKNMGGSAGPKYGSSDFDYENVCVWDFKAHVNNSGKPWAILNDSVAIESCIAKQGSIGFIIATGPAFYNDIQQTFKTWHGELSGTPSKYVLKGIETGRSSRRRKTIFMLSDILIFRLDGDQLTQGKEEGWIKGFQQGLPNSNGKPRSGKIQIHLSKMPPALYL